MSEGGFRRLFISTGEVSGDLQGSLSIEALYRKAAEIGMQLEIVALGGAKMAASGASLLGNTSSIGSVGLLEALPHIWPTLQLQQRAKQYLRQHPPDLVLLIDYMGPNVSIGNYVKQHLPGVPIVYYIAPQLWVWQPSKREPEKIVNIVDHMLAIFPEEANFYRERGASVTWVGHPLIDRIQTFPSREQARAKLGIDSEAIAIALVPCSRKQEVKYLLPAIFEAARQIQEKLPSVQLWIPLSIESLRRPIERAIARYGLRAKLVCENNREVLAAADLAIAKSGTVNLEIALLNVPQVVLYRVHPFTFWVARRLFNFSIPFISPPNLVQMQPIVPELLQEQATPTNIVQAALEILESPQRRQQMLTDYQQMRQTLGEVGACDRAAEQILQMLAKKTIFKF